MTKLKNLILQTMALLDHLDSNPIDQNYRAFLIAETRNAISEANLDPALAAIKEDRAAIVPLQDKQGGLLRQLSYEETDGKNRYVGIIDLESVRLDKPIQDEANENAV